MTSKIIEIELSDSVRGSTQDFLFEVTPERYNKLQNSMSSSRDKVTSLHNFAVACVHKDQKSEFSQLLMDNDGLAGQVAATLIDEYLPKIEITVKKQPPTQNLSNAAI